MSKEENRCGTCEHGKMNPATDDVLCKFKGIVAQNGICKRYKKNLLSLQPKKKRLLPDDFNPDDFSLD